ncbi:hypothetical protein NDU88_007183 [Pleurodeles waltl]|uniref:Uncharacterized protein n=1 Tax=Pleurodeles waltl TaxID=8319 RepID=A0AAV7N4M3_PLEWA|nr:hypothetical protein NDU88_007183 [Pleurodeles waltl]
MHVIRAGCVPWATAAPAHDAKDALHAGGMFVAHLVCAVSKHYIECTYGVQQATTARKALVYEYAQQACRHFIVSRTYLDCNVVPSDATGAPALPLLEGAEGIFYPRSSDSFTSGNWCKPNV